MPSIFFRIGLAKTIGFVITFVSLAIAWFFAYSAQSLIEYIAILLWYVTIAAFIGLFGVVTYHPWLKIKISWWFRGLFIGGWMNFILALIAQEKLLTIALYSYMTPESLLLLFLIDGAIFGLIVEYLTTKFAGEGAELFKHSDSNSP